MLEALTLIAWEGSQCNFRRVWGHDIRILLLIANEPGLLARLSYENQGGAYLSVDSSCLVGGRPVHLQTVPVPPQGQPCQCGSGRPWERCVGYNLDTESSCG